MLSRENNLYAREGDFSWDWEFAESPLSDRAWAFQERLMSTRILHYGKSEMFWECSTCSFREGSIKPFAELAHVTREAGFEKVDLKRLTCASNLASLPEKEILLIWRRIVSHYSGLLLTRDSDKLPAISGLAALIQQAMSARKFYLTYLAGLWKEDMASLLWRFTRGDSAKRIASPSWSWASYDRPIEWEMLNDSTPRYSRYDAIITEAIITPSISNTLGIAKLQGHIILKASTIKANYSSVPDPYNSKCAVTGLNGGALGTGWLDVHSSSFLKPRSRMCKAVWVSKRATSLGLEGIWFLLVEPAELDNTWKRIGVGSTVYNPLDQDYNSQNRTLVVFPEEVEEIMLV